MRPAVCDSLRLRIETAAFYVAAAACSIYPFITFVREILDESGYILAWDFFIHYKWVALLALAGVSAAVAATGFACRFEGRGIKTSLVLFVLWAAVSACFATDTGDAFFGSVVTRLGFLSFAAFLMIFTAVRTAFPAERVRALVNLTLAASSAMAGLCLLEFYGIDLIKLGMPEDFYFPTKVHATFGNSNYVGSYFSLIFPLAALKYIRSREHGTPLELFFVTAAAAGLAASVSRIAWLAVFLSMASCVLLCRKERFAWKRLAVVVGVVAAVALLLDVTGRGAIRERVRNATVQVAAAGEKDINSFGSSRVYVYRKFLSLTLSTPKNAMFGVGPDCLAYYGSIPEDDFRKYPFLAKALVTRAHSDLVEYTACMGIPALALYCAFILSILVPWLRRLSAASPEMIGLFAGWLGYLVQSLFNISVIGVIPLFFVFSALLDREEG